MDSGSNDITFNIEIYYSIPIPNAIITRNDAIKLIFVKLFSVSQNAHCDTEVEKVNFWTNVTSLLISQRMNFFNKEEKVNFVKWYLLLRIVF
jgi:hypothetical protein